MVQVDPSITVTQPRIDPAGDLVSGALGWGAGLGFLGGVTWLLAGWPLHAAWYLLWTAVCLLLRVGLRTRAAPAVSWAMVSGLAGVLVGGTPFAGGYAGPATLIWPLVVVLAAVLLGRVPSLVVGALAMVYTSSLFALESAGYGPWGHPSGAEWLGLMGGVLFLCAHVLGATMGRLQTAMAEARAFEQRSQVAKLGRDEEFERRNAVESRLQDALVAARQANRAKSRFLASMSHELRTPLNAIIGYAEILEEEAIPSSSDAHDLARIRTAGKHLLGLINDVLDLSKIEAGRMTLLPTAVELDQVVREVAETILPAAESRGNRLSLDAGDLGEIFADGMRLRQVLLNLLSNAVKFTEHGEVELSARRVLIDGREHVRFQVRDTGIGVSPSQQARLFSPFTQADSSTSRKYGGTGLGLVLCRRFAEMMEGTIELSSEEDVGTVVTFLLPTRTQASALEMLIQQRLEEADALVGSGAPVVLCIDDEASALHLLDRMLREEGVHPVPCSDPMLAIEYALRVRPRVITLDLHMPNLDGEQLLRLLKENPVLCEIPVVVLSVDGAASSTLDLGAAGWMRKPVDRSRLLSMIEELGRDNDAPVMIVDDDGPTRDVLVRMLDAGGINTVEACDGLQALEMLETVNPRMLLLDLMMPGMDGFQVAESLRADPRWRDLPIVVLTSATLSDADRARLEQVTTVLHKDESTLRNLVREVKRVA